MSTPKHPQVQAFERWTADSLTGTARLQGQLSETLYLAFCAGVGYQATIQRDISDSLGDMLALFDDEGNFHEEHQDQASVAIERATANLSAIRGSH